MKDKLRIVRPLNLLIIAVTMLIVLFKFRTENAESYWMYACLLILPAMLTAAAGYVINDIYDVETDKINKPHLLTVGKFISGKNAWLLYALITLVSLFISFTFSFSYLNINFCISLMLALYAIKLKGLPLIGNIVVALCTASVIAVCLFIASFDTFAGKVNFFGYIIFAFFTSLIREIVKDLQDVKGDKAAGLKTYAIVMGEKGAKIFIYVLIGVQILLSGIYSIITWGITMYASSIIMGVITISLFYFINHVANAKTQKEYLESSRLMKYIMVAGVINLIFS